jgi:hypothetical protein
MTVWSDSYRAGADLRNHQWKAVELTAANTVNLTNAATDKAIGILQEKPNTGEVCEVMHMGRSFAVADGSGTAIAVGDWVGANASGVLVKKETADFATLGIALVAASAANVVIEVLLFGPATFRTPLG